MVLMLKLYITPCIRNIFTCDFPDSCSILVGFVLSTKPVENPRFRHGICRLVKVVQFGSVKLLEMF